MPTPPIPRPSSPSPEPPAREGLAARLRRETRVAHERLDHAIMAGRPFHDLGRYGGFLRVQRCFHRDVDALYSDSRLLALFPDLAAGRRSAAIDADLADLGLGVDAAAADLGPAADAALPAALHAKDLASALGWLYVAEGSHLGAAVLQKAVAPLGLHDTRGARHLAAVPPGRMPRWKAFTAALDALPLTPDEQTRAVAGAQAAFDRVATLVATCLPKVPETSRGAWNEA